jgi:hypothetical protein
MFVPHSKHIFGPPEPITGIAVIFYMSDMKDDPSISPVKYTVDRMLNYCKQLTAISRFSYIGRG